MRKIAGIHAVHEALKVRPRAVKKIYVKSDFEKSPDLTHLIQLAQKFQIRFEKHAPAFLDKWTSSHQGIAAEVSEDPALNWERLRDSGQHCLLALDGLEDPQNFGSILRTSWLMGVEGILLPKNRSVGITTTVAKTACGGMEHVPVEIHSSLLSPLEILKERGFWVFGLSGKSTKSLWKLKIPNQVVWVIGSEENGIRSSTEGLCDELVMIPQTDRDASYNAAVATAITLAETRRQWTQSIV